MFNVYEYIFKEYVYTPFLNKLYHQGTLKTLILAVYKILPFNNVSYDISHKLNDFQITIFSSTRYTLDNHIYKLHF